MHHTYAASDPRSGGALHLLGGLGAGLLIALGACGGREELRVPVGSAGAAGGSLQVAGGGGGQSPRSAAGAPSREQAGASELGDDAGAAGAWTRALGCEPGGMLFAAGNYSDKAGNELWLRETATARALALIPSGVASPAKPPQLFALERVCLSGAALIVRDATSAYRVDFSQASSELSVCFSAATATVESAIALPTADLNPAADTGCWGKPFTVFAKETK
jgi:hypothetical protein